MSVFCFPRCPIAVGYACQRKLPSPGFQVEVVMIDYDGTVPTRSKADSSSKQTDGSSGYVPASNAGITASSNRNKLSGSEDKDDVFSDSDGEETEASKSRKAQATSGAGSAATGLVSNTTAEEIENLKHRADQLSLRSEEPAQNAASKEHSDGTGKPASALKISNVDSAGASHIKAIAADASVFSFGDEEDFESD